MLALSKLLEPVVDVVTRIDFGVSGPLDDPRLIEAGRNRARISSTSSRREAVDAVAPSLPAEEVTPSCSPQARRAGPALSRPSSAPGGEWA